ncbi:hypothetical protein EIP91_006888 [Steccherinum ochraceum]|uniref:Uncharacterized protein n=1 Tax=Steccherinum ochraceum TaxID=92696 RepID=A0A4R0RAT5_9APHY|nr:hypothetical protein EIP91_006888 [Steccherinum ochraceum]
MRFTTVFAAIACASTTFAAPARLTTTDSDSDLQTVHARRDPDLNLLAIRDRVVARRALEQLEKRKRPRPPPGPHPLPYPPTPGPPPEPLPGPHPLPYPKAQEY